MKNKLESIKRYVISRLGGQIVELCDSELNALEVSLDSASTRYWTAFPYQTTNVINTDTCASKVVKTINNLKDTSFQDQNIKDSAYFLGIGRYDTTDHYSYLNNHSNYFDSKLLGANAGLGTHPGNFPIQDPRYIADRHLLNSSETDLFTGELDYRHDVVNDSIVFITPSTHSKIHVWYNWGFCCDKTVELLPMVHFDIFKKMVTFEFLETIIAARSSVELNSADFSLNESDIQAKRDRLIEELEKEINEMSITVGVWG